VDHHGTEDFCDDDPDSCDPPCEGDAFADACGDQPTGGGPPPGGGGAQPTQQPKCYQDQSKIGQTLGDIGANILAIFSADFQSTSSNSLSYDLGVIGGFVQQAVNSELQTTATSPLTFYNGSHFNLDLNITSLEAALGAESAEFQSDFNGNGDGTRQKTIVGTNPNVLNYYLHSKNDSSVSGQEDVHLDRWSGQNATLPLHGVYDVLGGHLGHPCLDPAWHQ
jgi:hypothetical protein